MKALKLLTPHSVIKYPITCLDTESAEALHKSQNYWSQFPGSLIPRSLILNRANRFLMVIY